MPRPVTISLIENPYFKPYENTIPSTLQEGRDYLLNITNLDSTLVKSFSLPQLLALCHGYKIACYATAYAWILNDYFTDLPLNQFNVDEQQMLVYIFNFIKLMQPDTNLTLDLHSDMKFDLFAFYITLKKLKFDVAVHKYIDPYLSLSNTSYGFNDLKGLDQLI